MVSKTDMREDELISLARSALSQAFPNPQRIDCPDRKLRERLARCDVELQQNWEILEHICACSPCFSEHLSFRKKVRRRRNIFQLGGLAISIAVLAATYSFLQPWLHGERLTATELRGRIPGAPPAPDTSLRAPTVVAQLDLAQWTLDRGGPVEAPPRPLSLRRARLSLRIQLPLLSQPGLYRVVLRKGDAAPLIDQSIRARVVDGSTLLEPIELDLATSAPGDYLLTTQRQGASAPREFPVRIE